jgi:hypothetical protein
MLIESIQHCICCLWLSHPATRNFLLVEKQCHGKNGSFLGGHPQNIQLSVQIGNSGPAIPMAKTVHHPVHYGPNFTALFVNVNT